MYEFNSHEAIISDYPESSNWTNSLTVQAVMLFLSDEHMQSGPMMPSYVGSISDVVWGLRSVSRVERERESLLEGCPGCAGLAAVTGRAPPPERQSGPEPHSVQQLGRRHSHTSHRPLEHWPVDTAHVDTCPDSQPGNLPVRGRRSSATAIVNVIWNIVRSGQSSI